MLMTPVMMTKNEAHGARLPEDPQLPELDAVESKDAEAPEADPFGLNALVPEKKRFSHPVADLSPSALLIYGGQGIIEARNNTGPNGDLCGGLSIRAKVPFSPLVTLQTTVGVTVQGAEETDVYGVPFIVSGSGQRYQQQSAADHSFSHTPKHDTLGFLDPLLENLVHVQSAVQDQRLSEAGRTAVLDNAILWGPGTSHISPDSGAEAHVSQSRLRAVMGCIRELRTTESSQPVPKLKHCHAELASPDQLQKQLMELSELSMQVVLSMDDLHSKAKEVRSFRKYVVQKALSLMEDLDNAKSGMLRSVMDLHPTDDHFGAQPC
ncbi:hypothetical protein WJX77_012682 [Trebouxia sp. C0004]